MVAGGGGGRREEVPDAFLTGGLLQNRRRRRKGGAEEEDTRERKGGQHFGAGKGAAVEGVHQGGGADGAVAFGGKVDGGIGPPMTGQPFFDKEGEGPGVPVDREVVLLMFAVGGGREAGAGRVHQDDVAEVERAVGVVLQRKGRGRLRGDRVVHMYPLGA